MPGRFAPTPSGRMHIGNIYAMLGAWLSARSSNDAVYLRIEDIDEPRVVPGAADLIMDDLQWLGLDWDGAPVYQSARHHLYEDALRALQRLTIDDSGAVTADATGNATPLIYPCFCSRADIRAASAPQEGDRFMIYPGTCRRLAETNPDEVRARLAQGRRHSLRIAMPASNSTIAFEDRVFGHQEFNVTREIGDSVVRRADGLFSYQLVVVVDDLAMGVDDIVRGPADMDSASPHRLHRLLLRPSPPHRQCEWATTCQAREITGHGHSSQAWRHTRTNHRILRLAARTPRRSAFHASATHERPRGPDRIQLDQGQNRHRRPFP